MAVTPLLHSLARLYNIQASFQDGLGQQRNAPAEAVLAALRALGAPVNGLAEVAAAHGDAGMREIDLGASSESSDRRDRRGRKIESYSFDLPKLCISNNKFLFWRL